jgi:aminoglycoside phosphotransferase (APT) family kinase protein
MALPASDPSFAAPSAFVPIDCHGLGLYLAAQGFDFDPERPIRQFSGGLANRTYLIEVDGQDVVLRCPPTGKLPQGGHDMGREHRILAALSPVLPFVPAAIHYCASPEVIGAPFHLLEYREGAILRSAGQVQALSEAERGNLSAVLVDTLVRIHQVDAEACGLATLGRPEGFIERTIAGWGRRGREAVQGPQATAALERILSWLDGRQFVGRPGRLIHLDFKLDNLILDPVDLGPRAVLDWDMGTRGDPVFDLAIFLSYWAEPGDPAALQDGVVMPSTFNGFWSRREIAAAYARLTGEALDDIAALYVLALLRLGIVYFQLHAKWRDGAVKSERYRDFANLGAAVLAHAAELAASPEALRRLF